MLAIAKLVVLAFAVTGVAFAGGMATGAVSLPMDKAIEVHKDHLTSSPTTPDSSVAGQQNSLDHLFFNQERWVAKHGTVKLPDDNQTDDLGSLLMGILLF